VRREPRLLDAIVPVLTASQAADRRHEGGSVSGLMLFVFVCWVLFLALYVIAYGAAS
jgi:hypothetical protein